MAACRIVIPLCRIPYNSKGKSLSFYARSHPTSPGFADSIDFPTANIHNWIESCIQVVDIY